VARWIQWQQVDRRFFTHFGQQKQITDKKFCFNVDFSLEHHLSKFPDNVRAFIFLGSDALLSPINPF